MGNVKQELEQLFKVSLKTIVPNEVDVHPLISVCTANFGDYQWYFLLFVAIKSNLPESEMVESCSVPGAGFVNVVLSKSWLAKSIQTMLREGIETWAPRLSIDRAVVDFSSPNIAKEMHVGHLRSTIIGDSLARLLEFSGVEVLCRNHVGDWGTQFGMLIEFLFEQYPEWDDDNDIPIKDLQLLHFLIKYDLVILLSLSYMIFKERAQKAVVSLQAGEPTYRKAWAQICEISRREFQKIYERLRVNIEEKGESFYNPYIPRVLEILSNEGLIEESEGARVIHIDGKKIPLIVVKRDGGFNYASTDLTALWYRLYEEKAEWIIYVTDVGQREHFEMFFHAAKRAGWLPHDDAAYPKVSHVGFGIVKGADGKRFRTRSSEVVRLVDLLDEAKNRSKQTLIERGKALEWTEEELEQTAEALGYGAVKYADLKNNRASDYTFNFDQMLNDKGDSADGELVLDHPDERALAVQLLKFSEVVEEACSNLLPSVLCEYFSNVADCYSKVYNNCKVHGSPQETSRLLLNEATAVVLRKGLELLGITPLYKL
ncbi:hypothetical protein RND81_07G088000 [Saponaria officinalis]|uniref:arginine--tRNA ligase n=1 Tax=Saponaria officinalis TaxID=3572 RepID=A0AAW1JNB8_SAPOF